MRIVVSTQFPVPSFQCPRCGDLRAELATGNWQLARPSLVTPLRRLHVFEGERLPMKRGRVADAVKLPGRGVSKALVVAQRFTVGRLALLAEVAAAALRSVERVE